MDRFVVDFDEIDRMQVALVGGKGAGLGELARIAGVRVPPGFCVTTAAFERILAGARAMDALLDRLAGVRPDDRATIGTLSAAVRAAIEAVVVPDDVGEAIAGAVARLGVGTACAVRSSATAEDLPTASFAGQHDTYLNVVGPGAILRHVSRCWASLFTDRAVTYRMRNGIDHRAVRMAVVVQRMVSPQASGIVFTADPLTGNRKVATVEATSGLGEALVSGVVNADVYEVRDGTVIETMLRAEPRVTLTEAQVVRVVEHGRLIEAHFGRPQDIEWCLADGEFHIVQSRPITTLFPVPASDDGGDHVYVSVGHQQMMTDAMKPLGLSFWQMTTPRPMAEAGGRLFVDVTPMLAAPASRATMLELMEKSDPLIRDAIEIILARDAFVPALPDASSTWTAPSAGPAPLEADPTIVAALIAESRASVEAAKREIATKSGPALMEFIETDIQELRRILYDPRSRQVYMSAMEATWWLTDRLQAWLGEKNAADVFAQSVPDNVTSEMGLALLDVADAVRPHAEVVRYLESVAADDASFLARLTALPGGRDVREAILAWLARYGMRGVGEIDITRPRWSERPATLVPLILANVRSFAPGEAVRRFERGRREAEEKEQAVLARLRALPDGAQKADEAKRMIDRVRTFMGYREYPKYDMVSRYFVYKQALMREAARLVGAGVLREAEDIHYLDFRELRDLVRTRQADERLIRERREEFRGWQALTPPRVLTSEGEALTGAYRRDDVPEGALAGLAVSAGTVEGRARVVLDMADADIAPGDVLVTAYTDPSWTPLFVAIAGLVTEVGGLMTHGAVIAREYGLPAVVGVQQATRLIRDGQRIRVHGTEGYVEMLD